jgi:hypothetical protein
MSSPYEVYLRRYLNDNGALWTSDQIERWALRAEQEICRIHPAVIIREQLPITLGVPLYTIPPPQVASINSLGINQITWKGDVLTALSLQQAHDLFPNSVILDTVSAVKGAFEPSAFSNTAFYVFAAQADDFADLPQGKPEFWWYSGYNENVIQLYPTPSEAIPYVVGETRFWDSAIPHYCIVEYRTISYATEKPLYRLVRQLIKDYVLAEAFSIEGKGQQIREAVMLRKRFKVRLDLYKALASNVFVANKHAFGNQVVTQMPSNRPNFGNDLGIRVRR